VLASLDIDTADRRRRSSEFVFGARDASLVHDIVTHLGEVAYRFRFWPEPRFEFISNSVTELLGYSPDECYSSAKIARHIIHAEDAATIQGLLDTPLIMEARVVVRWVRRDGRTVRTEQRLAITRDASGAAIMLEGLVRGIAPVPMLRTFGDPESLAERSTAGAALHGSRPGTFGRASEERKSGPTGLLSARERQVVVLLARGYSNPQIGEVLCVTAHTVKVHVEHILAKLGVGSRTEAAVRGMQLGYVTTDQRPEAMTPGFAARRATQII
jgi:DNA-binding CsgD family transcriptional regulator